MSRRTQYPPIEPYDSGYLAVGDGHEVYYEQSRQPARQARAVRARRPRRRRRRQRAPLLRSRRATASSCSISAARGAAVRTRRSRPIRPGTSSQTWSGCAGISESIAGSCSAARGAARSRSRMQRRIQRAVSELVLRGIFLLRPLELTWFYQFGASMLFPEQWQEYLAPIPHAERHDLLGAYHRRLLVERRRRAARGGARVVGLGGSHELAAAESRNARTSSARRSSRWRSRASRPTIS